MLLCQNIEFSMKVSYLTQLDHLSKPYFNLKLHNFECEYSK